MPQTEAIEKRILIRCDESDAHYDILEVETMAGVLNECYQAAKQLQTDIGKGLFVNSMDGLFDFIHSPNLEMDVRTIAVGGESVPVGNLIVKETALAQLVTLPSSFTDLQEKIAVYNDFHKRREKIVQWYVELFEIKKDAITISKGYKQRIEEGYKVYLDGNAANAHADLQKICDAINEFQEKYDIEIIKPGGEVYPLASLVLYAAKDGLNDKYNAYFNENELLNIEK